MTTSHPNLYYCAVALNNIAVCLVQQHCYQQALTTLTDAVSLLRLSSNDMTSEQISLCYQRACFRLAKPCSDVSPERGLQFRVVNGQEDSVAADATSNSLVLFRIETFSKLELDSSMMLHNFGMVYLCLAKSSSVVDTSKLLKTGYKLLTMALGVLQDEKQQEDLLCPMRVSIVVLRSLVGLSILLEVDRDTHRFQWYLENLTEQSRVIERLLGGCCVSVAAAA